ncbi:MAG: Ig-like domain-containing protein, partial [Dietzia sp.]|nr:Ig-like domain-containing protein [Dietzia sp.]
MQDAFTIKVSDGHGGVTAVPVTVQISPKNVAPTTKPVKGKADSSTSVTTGTVGAADADGDILAYSVTGDPTKGTVTLDATGGFVYTPTAEARHAAALTGAPTESKRDTFTIMVSDGHGGTKAVTFTTQVLAQNAGPTAAPSTGTPETSTGAVTGSVGASDNDGDALAYALTKNPARGSVILDANGDFTYTPTAAARHTASATNATVAQRQDSFTVTVTDGYGGKMVVVVTAAIAPTNAGPSAVATMESPNMSNGVVIGTVTASDPDGDTLKYQVTGEPAKGSVTVNSAGRITYRPTATARHAAAAIDATDEQKQDTFTITVADGHGGTTSVTLTAAIAPKNTRPSATPTAAAPDAATGSVSGSVGGTDADNDALSYSLNTEPSKGAVTLNADGTFTYVPTLAARQRAGRPNASAADKRDTFKVTVQDGYGGLTVITVTASVSGVGS